MRPLIVLSALFAAACAAPAAQVAVAHAAAHPAVAVKAAAPIHVPAPYSTSHVAGAPTTTLHKAPAQVQKQLHYGSKDFISGYTTSIHKPAIPDFRIAVPTALKGTHRVNAPIVKTIKEPHIVNEPYPVEKRVPVPYDVPVVKEQVVEVPVPYHVDRPYHVPVPTPVRGEDIVNYRQTAPVVHHEHTNVHTAPVAVQTYAATHAVAAHPAPVAAYAAAPAAVAAGPIAAAPIAAAAAPIAGLAHH